MKQKIIIARTHPAEYLIHKYWARKPHNVLAEYIQKYFDETSVLCDPFCGSGVFLAEAKKQNIGGFGFDINPAAYELTDFTINPPPINLFETAVMKLLDHLESEFGDIYKIGNKTIRYIAHEMVATCISCHSLNMVGTCRKRGNSFLCSRCETKISFSLERCSHTRISKVICTDKSVIVDENQITQFQERTNMLIDEPDYFAKPAVENRRILAHKGLRFRDFFTVRALNIINGAVSFINDVDDEKTRRSLMLFFNSSVVQASKLIPYRNNLSSGGPAWSIPGFWVAPKHLEMNLISVLEGRAKKYLRALKSLSEGYKKDSTKISLHNMSFQKGNGLIKDDSLDGIFFDPPYGDNVPYLEFSFIWNTLYNKEVDYNDEIIVSDRKQFCSSWDKYHKDIDEVVAIFWRKLKKNGVVILTFNNLDYRAWAAIITSFQKHTFGCIEANYQVPAVVSPKAQMARNTSYIGDYYCVFQKATAPPHQDREMDFDETRIVNCLLSRRGKCATNLVERVCLLQILSRNLPFSLVKSIQDIIKKYAHQEKNYYVLREKYMDEEKSKELDIGNLILKETSFLLDKGIHDKRQIYSHVIEQFTELGAPCIQELNYHLKSGFEIKKDTIWKKEKTLFL